MAIISISISESSDQIISGIPKFIVATSNIPASIFYTLDGTTPTVNSNILVSSIILPTNLLSVSLKLFATNGTDSSAIITKSYSSNISDVRMPHSTVTNLGSNNNFGTIFPFGSNIISNNIQYQNPSNAGITVNNPLLSSSANGFDGYGNPAAFTNQSINNYKIIYSTANSIGEEKSGIGTLPAKTTIIGKSTPTEYTQEQSKRSDRVFNPKALVIYQDSTTESPSDPVHINRQFFSLENPEVVRDGNLLFNSSLDSPTTTGSFLKSHYNPRTNMITYYYYDNNVNRWIISSTPYEPKDPNAGALYNMVFSRPTGSVGTVFKWNLFMYRTLI